MRQVRLSSLRYGLRMNLMSQCLCVFYCYWIELLSFVPLLTHYFDCSVYEYEYIYIYKLYNASHINVNRYCGGLFVMCPTLSSPPNYKLLTYLPPPLPFLFLIHHALTGLFLLCFS